MTSIGEIDGQQAFNCYPAYREGFSESTIRCIPLHLEDLSKNIFLTANVYLNFREEITWLSELYDEKLRTGELRLMSPENYFKELEKINSEK